MSTQPLRLELFLDEKEWRIYGPHGGYRTFKSLADVQDNIILCIKDYRDYLSNLVGRRKGEEN